MEPLRTFFPRLKETELNALIDLVKLGENPVSCTVCNGDIFTGRDCSQCPFKGRVVRDLLIESHIPLVMDIARKIGGRQRKECTSVGLLALTEAVNRIPRDIRCLEAYIRKCVTDQVKLFLIKDTVIQVPPYGSLTHGFLRHVRSLSGSNAGQLAVLGEQTTVDLNELLSRIPQNRTEETIMRCITEGGYSLRDMAEMCNLGEPRVSQIRQDLLGRIDTSIRKEPV